jgi:hypothetical protein
MAAKRFNISAKYRLNISDKRQIHGHGRVAVRLAPDLPLAILIQ